MPTSALVPRPDEATGNRQQATDPPVGADAYIGPRTPPGRGNRQRATGYRPACRDGTLPSGSPQANDRPPGRSRAVPVRYRTGFACGKLRSCRTPDGRVPSLQQMPRRDGTLPSGSPQANDRPPGRSRAGADAELCWICLRQIAFVPNAGRHGAVPTGNLTGSGEKTDLILRLCQRFTVFCKGGTFLRGFSTPMGRTARKALFYQAFRAVEIYVDCVQNGFPAENIREFFVNLFSGKTPPQSPPCPR